MRAAIRRAWPWLRVLLGAAILAVLVWRLGTGAFVAGLRAAVDPLAMLAALGIGLVTTVLSAARWQVVARRIGLTLPLGTAVADVYRATFLNTVLPGGVLGDVHRAVHHGRESGDVGRGVRAVVLERVAGQVMPIVVGLAVLATRPSLLAVVVPDAARGPGAALVAALVTLAAVLVGVVFAARRGRRVAGRLRRAVSTAVADTRAGLLSLDTWPELLLLSTAALLAHLGLFLVAARTAGSDAPVSQLLPLLMLALLAMSLPLNIGGWGPREGMAAVAFAAAGLGATQGVTVAVVYGGLTFVSTLPGVAVLAARLVAPQARRLLAHRVARPRAAGLQVQFEQHVLAHGDAANRRA
ncbi:lysylphosphatidylglycerol synthase transmembrane domain-containing protein [Gandjariella thermophila]|uniref:Dolichol-P-glucose synthetase-like protein n=1 Tax=Gandjariella thermophila TaxID=1931992 RepID=A0A4D4JD01_9PSEU|nr:lysylphosphatidylglycerol synthase transmembrane domain-containing protein [Gandjariella thermophila]GDY32538.1 hypothetical protein GTS_41710 [Gandjariella thermophila]